MKILKESIRFSKDQKKFLLPLGILPEEGDSLTFDGEGVFIRGEMTFVASTVRLLATIMLNPSLTAQDFECLIAGYSNPEEIDELNQLRRKLGIVGDVSD